MGAVSESPVANAPWRKASAPVANAPWRKDSAPVGNAPWRKDNAFSDCMLKAPALSEAPWHQQRAPQKQTVEDDALARKVEVARPQLPLTRQGPSEPEAEASSKEETSSTSSEPEAEVGKDAEPEAPSQTTTHVAAPAELGDFFKKGGKKKLRMQSSIVNKPEEKKAEVKEAPAVFDVRQMLQWRAAAQTEPKGPEGAMLGYSVAEAEAETAPSNEEQPEKLSKKAAEEPTTPASAKTAPSPSPAARPQAPEPAPGPGGSGGWRDTAITREVSEGSGGWRAAAMVREAPRDKTLEVSDNSWAAQQRARRKHASTVSADDEVVRSIKSILNKLTLERFSTLKEKLIHCGIQATSHVEVLIKEVFEKATTQHHFIDMYADLCTLLEEHFTLHPIGDSPKFSFKRLLLNECQASFERHLAPPSQLATLSSEERVLAEAMYKRRMLGNIRFVGALLARKMLASKVLIAICEELLSDPSPEALESLAALLTTVGPVFDKPEWSYHTVLNHFFEKVQAIIKKPSCEPRAKCLLKDVLDLRAADWHSLRPQQQERPTTLDEVAQQAQAENGGAPSPKKAPPRTPTVLRQPVKPPQPVPELPQEEPSTAKSPPPSTTGLAEEPRKEGPTQSPPKAGKAPAPAQLSFDRDVFRAEVSKILAELRYSGDGVEAAKRLSEQSPPPARCQSEEFCQLLVRTAEEGDAAVRKAGFAAVAALFTARLWCPDAFAEGLRIFVEEACEDLRCDVPSLPKILCAELHPALKSLVHGLSEAKRWWEALIA
jgi:hypothetical protein